ncbi:MAG: hypothetical protein H7Z21_16040, partial [Hymenobacter sp.]|nr:hypothetical protein [Hymenobacter sp.]
MVLNHILSANVAAIASALLTLPPDSPPSPAAGNLLRPVRQAQQALHRSLRRLDAT